MSNSCTKNNSFEKFPAEISNLKEALAELQNKSEIIRLYAEETKKNLDAARNENADQILKIDELIKEKIKLAGDLDAVVSENMRLREELSRGAGSTMGGTEKDTRIV